MTTRLLRYLVLTGLVVALFAGMPDMVSASPPGGPTVVYFPWVPHGEVIEDPRGFPDSGPYYGVITVQNLEDEPIRVFRFPMVLADGVIAQQLLTLEAGESATISLEDVFGLEGIPESTGVRVAGFLESNIEAPAKISAVMRQMSPSLPSPLDSTSDAHITVSGYTGLTEVGLATPSILPIAQTNSNWNTLIRLTNFDFENAANTAVFLFPTGGGAPLGPYPYDLDPGETGTLDLLDAGVPEGWIGHAGILSDGPIGAVAERIKNETNMLIMNTSRSTNQTSTTQVAPLILRNWNNWNTGISITNLENVDNQVTVTYLNQDGGQVHVDGLTLGGNDMDFIYLPAEAGGAQPLAGSAIIEGTGDFIATVDEVKYFGDDGDTGHAMSYHAEYLQALPGQSLSLPVFKKGQPDGGGDTSGVQIFNLYGNATVEIVILDEQGGPVLGPFTIDLDPHQGYNLYSMNLAAIPAGFTGSAILSNLEVEDESSGIVAISNLVNYDVQYDGSVSYNLTLFSVDEGGPWVPDPVIILAE